MSFVWLLAAIFDRLSLGEDEGQAEEALIRRLRARDRDVVVSLYDRYAARVYSLVLRILNDQADTEEVVQDVFAQAWAQSSRYDASRGSLAAWLLTIARSRAIDRLRARRARPDGSSSLSDSVAATLPGSDPLPEAVMVTNEQVARLQAALAALPFMQRVTLEMAYFEDLSQSEIAEKLEQPIGTIKTRIRLGLMKLRAALLGAPCD